ncbi:MAG: glycosyltransferase [Pseudomonadota bacterium]|nr:glycosyltransferase [Pseudomonadota bacterium]
MSRELGKVKLKTPICHIIVGLDVGGAETMLKRLIESNPSSISETVVVSLTSLGVIGESLRARGVCVHALGMSSLWHSPIILLRLIRLIRQYRPAVVQTWMYHADLFGGLAARLAGSCSVVWNIRSTAIPQGALSITFWLVRFCAVCSYFIPDRIICCAISAKTAHIKLRYAEHKMTVIPNGYDFSAFELDLNSRARIRLEAGANDGDIVIGVVGRFDLMKDYHNFVNAASYVAAKRSGVKFIMVGRGNEWSNDTLRGWIGKANLMKRFHLVGQQANVVHYLSAMDVFCLSSVNEAFPNVVVEAMAIGLPCVVTQAGDAADILGDAAFVVPVKDPVLLADALLRMCHLNPVDRRMLGERNVKKVREEYGIEKIRRKYEEVYDEVSRK